MEAQNYVQEAEEIIKSEKMISNDFAKKILIWFFRQSENFTKPIAVSVYTQDPDKFELFDIASIVNRAKAFITHSFFEENGINMVFDSEDGVLFCQNSMVGLVKEPFASKEYIRNHPEKQNYQIVNEKACTMYLGYPTLINITRINDCEILQLDIDAIEAIEI